MGPIGSSFFTVLDLPSGRPGGSKAGPIVVWLQGEHDLSTDDALCLTLARAIALDSAVVVLDLSDVQFLAASTLGVIVRSREFLRQRSRSLMVRSPPAYVRRVIDACGLSDLLGPGSEEPRVSAAALDSWAEVPAADRCYGQHVPAATVPERPAAGAGRASASGGSFTYEYLERRC